MNEQTIQQPTRKPEIAGELTKQEQGLLEQMRNRAQQIVHRVGSMEVEKARLMKMLDQQEQQIQIHLQAIGNRLEIPQGAGWQVAGDKAIIVQPAPEPSLKAEEPVADESVNEVDVKPTDTEPMTQAAEDKNEE